MSDLLTSDIGPCGYPTVWNEEWDIDSNHEKEIYSGDDVSTSNQEKYLSSNDESIGDLENED